MGAVDDLGVRPADGNGPYPAKDFSRLRLGNGQFPYGKGVESRQHACFHRLWNHKLLTLLYRVEKIMGTELTQTALAFFLPQFENLWGIEELSVKVSPGFIR